MKAIDFEYDGKYLSDFDCIICTFDSNGLDTVSSGSEIQFQTTAVQNGKRYIVSSSIYDSCIETSFQICKNPNLFDRDSMWFTLDEQREISRWLNRMDFHKFRLLDDECDYSGCYFEGSFNINRIELSGNVVGLELVFKSNKPFGVGDEAVYRFDNITKNKTCKIFDTSDELGYIYLDLEITCNSNGDLKIYNLTNNKTTEIKNCISGEIIKIHDLIIETSSENHADTIMDDFNFVFPTIENSIDNRMNKYIFSIPCSVIVKYKPIRKVGI